MPLSRRQKLAGIFKIAALFEASQTAGVAPSKELVQGMADKKMLAMENVLRPAKESAKEPPETIAPSRVSTV